jgi:hypothetical protein
MNHAFGRLTQTGSQTLPLHRRATAVNNGCRDGAQRRCSTSREGAIFNAVSAFVEGARDRDFAKCAAAAARAAPEQSRRAFEAELSAERDCPRNRSFAPSPRWHFVTDQPKFCWKRR